MPNADLARRMRPCPTCGGSGSKSKLCYDQCPTCTGSKVVPESDAEYAARLVELVEQARRERDKPFTVECPSCLAIISVDSGLVLSGALDAVHCECGETIPWVNRRADEAMAVATFLAGMLAKIDSEGGCPPGKSPAKGCNQNHQQCWLDAAARAVAGKE